MSATIYPCQEGPFGTLLGSGVLERFITVPNGNAIGRRSMERWSTPKGYYVHDGRRLPIILHGNLSLISKQISSCFSGLLSQTSGRVRAGMRSAGSTARKAQICRKRGVEV